MRIDSRMMATVGILNFILGFSGCITQNESPSSVPVSNNSQSRELRVSRVLNSMNTAGSNGNFVIDGRGNIFYPNPNGNVINKIDVNGNQTVFAGSGLIAYTDGTGLSASFYAPRLIAIDKIGNLYLADGFKVRKITPAAVVTTLADMGNGGIAKGIAADANGNVYFVWDEGGSSAHLIKKIAPGGSVSTFAGKGTVGRLNGTGTTAEFNYPQDLVVDSGGNVFVADAGNFLIRKITPSGEVSTFAGSGIQVIQDGIGTSAGFAFYNYYAHISIDSSDNIFVGDMTGISANRTDVIRKITPSGVVTTFCGSANWISSTGSCSEISAVSRFGVAAGIDESVYFADNGSLFKISYSLK